MEDIEVVALGASEADVVGLIPEVASWVTGFSHFGKNAFARVKAVASVTAETVPIDGIKGLALRVDRPAYAEAVEKRSFGAFKTSFSFEVKLRAEGVVFSGVLSVVDKAATT